MSRKDEVTQLRRDLERFKEAASLAMYGRDLIGIGAMPVDMWCALEPLRHALREVGIDNPDAYLAGIADRRAAADTSSQPVDPPVPQ